MLTRATFLRTLLRNAAAAPLMLAAGCALNSDEDQAKVFAELRRLYLENIAGEGVQIVSPFVPPPRAFEFWALYATERQRTSQRVMLRELRKIISEHGVSALLFASVTPGLRGQKEDELINEMIIADTPCTPKAARELAQNAELKERLRVAAHGRRIGGGR